MDAFPLMNVGPCPQAGRSEGHGSWRRVALAAAAAYALLLGLFVIAHKGDPGSLVCADPARIGKAPLEVVKVGFGQGYDGQFYYAIARNPWRTHSSEEIDGPPRHVRILYPALGWLLSGGDRTALLWVLPLVNLVALAGLAACGAHVVQARGLSPWWGLLLPAAVGGGIAALRDLTDVVSACAIAGLLVARLRGWHPALLLLAAAATLFSREQNIIVVAAVLAVTVWERRWSTAAGLVGVIALWAGWVVALRLAYGTWPVLTTQGNLGLPLSGLRYALTHLKPVHSGVITVAINVLCLLSLIIQIGLLAYLARLRPDPALLLVALAGFVLLITTGVSIYEDRWSFMRVLAWLPLALWLGYGEVRRSWALVVLALPGLVPLYDVLHDLRHVL